jgi:hypothetical protein
MYRVWPVVAAALIGTTANGNEKPAPRATPAARLAAIQKEHTEADAANRKAIEEQPDTDEGKRKARDLRNAFLERQAHLFQEAVELAKGDPKSDTGLAALEWVLTIPRSYYVPAGKPALELVTQHHAANPKVGKIVAWVGYYTPQEGAESRAAADALIKAVAEKNPDRTARGQAMIALAWQAKRKFALAEHRNLPDAEQRASEAERLFEVVIKDYADCPHLFRENARLLGEEANQELFELRHLRRGKTAPEIEGEDLDGVKFKLSDYRGKVVVLDFWGHW